MGDEHVPSFLLVELVTHAFRELAELALRFGIVGVDHEVLQVPEVPAQVLETLSLLEEAGDLGADLERAGRQYEKVDSTML